MTLLDLHSAMAPGTMNNVIDNDSDTPLPLAVEHFLDLLTASRLADFHASAGPTDASLVEKTHTTLDCFILHQAEILKSATQTCNIATPEIFNMLIPILRETYPTSDFCLSVRYAVSKPLLKDPYPALCPYRIADLLVRLPSASRGSSDSEPLTPPSILHAEHSSSPSFGPHLSPNGSPLGKSITGGGSTMDELKRYAGRDETTADSDNDVVLGEFSDMETTDGAESDEVEEDENEETDDDDSEAFEDDDDDEAFEEEDDDGDGGSDTTSDEVSEEEVNKGNDHQLIVSADDDEIQEGTLVCVGLADDIAALLTSALYHRHVSGMGGPLIGLAYAKTSPEVHVVIAWLDEQIDEGNDLPGVHLFFGSDSTCFDLSQPVHTFGLAYFLASTRDALLKNDYWTHERQLIPWRADLHSSLRGDSVAVDNDKSTDSNVNILKWVNAIDRTFSDNSDTKDIMSKSVRKTETDNRPPASSSQSFSSGRDITDTSSEHSGDSVTSTVSYLSASEFVKRPAKHGTEEYEAVEQRVRAYFTQRKVVSVSARGSTGKVKFHLPKEYLECTALQRLHVSPTCLKVHVRVS
ncbi:hypothetical protein BDZ89DRAFT_101803 [Hymenopellis radicata]|nr:hypothetical protein BDZ89DRAFT_101803 [Hymenopellis radicata]